MIVAIALVGVNAAYQLGSSFSAHGIEYSQSGGIDETSREAAGVKAAEDAYEKATGETAAPKELSARELVESAQEDSSEEPEDQQQVTVTVITED